MPRRKFAHSKLRRLGQKRPEVGKVLREISELFGEDNRCLLALGRLFKMALTESPFEDELLTALLKDQASHHFWNCYRLGVSYNELCQILGREQTEALIEDD